MSEYRLKAGKLGGKVLSAYKKAEDAFVDAFLEKGGDGETCLRLKTGKVGRAVVDGYQEVEATVVGAYKKIEEAFVDAFWEKADANWSPTPAHLSEAAESTPGGSETHGAPDAGRTDA